MSVWMKKMNNLLLSTEHGEDFKSVQMRSFGREFQKEIILKHSQLHSGLISKIEKITTCQPPLVQIHLQKHPDSPKLLIKWNLYQDIMETSILTKKVIESISENQQAQISIKEIHIWKNQQRLQISVI